MSEEALRRIEWLFTESAARPGSDEPTSERYQPVYGNLAEANTCRLIADSVGQDMLTDIVSEYLDLLDTSAAVFEQNGDYALGIFGSGWCRFLDSVSRGLCGECDNREAMSCGYWHCHESRWKTAAKRAIETGEPADVECMGGLRIHARPIWAGEEIVGAITFGYGDPPRDPAKLRAIAEAYGVSVAELRAKARAYESRPPFMIDLAKRRLVASARLIGEIVERKRAEVARKQVSDELRKLSHAVEQSSSTVVITDATGNIEYVNPKFSQLTGYTIEEVIGQNPRLLKSGQMAPEEYRRLWATIIAGGEWRGEFLNKKKNGELYWESASISAVRDAQGTITHFVAVKEDITERKRAEQFREEYLSLVSHDLRSPLANVLGSAQMLQRSMLKKGLEQEARSAGGIVKSAKRMAAMIDEIVDSARLEAGQLEMRKEPADLLYLVYDLVDRTGTPEERQRIAVEAPEQLPAVLADPQQVERVLTNLLTNALKYSPPDSVVLLRIEPGEGEVEVSVADQGVGIPGEDLPRVFERNFRAKTAGQREGLGLGLYIARLIVKAHGGRVWAESTVGEGSIFHFTLPLASNEAGKSGA